MDEIRRIERRVMTPEASKRFWEEDAKQEQETRAKLPPEEQKMLAERDRRVEAEAKFQAGFQCDSAGW